MTAPRSFRAALPGSDLDNTKPYAFAFLLDQVEEDAGRPAPLGTHATGLICMQVSGGRFAVELEGSRMVLPMHTAAWIPPGVPHAIFQARKVVSIAVFVAPEVAEAFMPKEPMRLIINPMTEEMIKHFARVWGSSEKSITARRVISLVIQELRSAPQLPPHIAPLPAHPMLRKIATGFEDRAGRNRTVADWAEHLHISEKTLERLVVKETGLTFSRWRLHFRMLPALRPLAEGASVEAVAAGAGYETTSAFIRAFSRVFGTTPGKYRENLRGEEPATFPDLAGRF